MKYFTIFLFIILSAILTRYIDPDGALPWFLGYATGLVTMLINEYKDT